MRTVFTRTKDDMYYPAWISALRSAIGVLLGLELYEGAGGRADDDGLEASQG